MAGVINIDRYFRLDATYAAPPRIASKYPGRPLRMVSSWFPRTVYDPAELLGEALVQGIGFVTVLEIKRFDHPPPWHEGESCGLVLEILDSGD